MAILRVINPKAKLHMDMLVSMNVLNAKLRIKSEKADA